MSHADRFDGRAAAYAQGRPGYPAALGAWLRGTGLLRRPVADLGAGTGLFTRVLLAGGATVTAIEPNAGMRAVLQTSLEDAVTEGRLRVQAGTSEAMGLPDASVALITAAQAAHWFDPVPTVQEWRRVLRPGGQVLLVWNDWRGLEEGFNPAYGAVVRPFLAAGTPDTANRVPEDRLPALLPGGFDTQVFEQAHALTRERLHALAGSVSYLPAPDSPDFPALTAALDAAFDAHAQAGEVTLIYRTYAYLGRLD
ncbi:methyltransferase domain-containing protein [Deinococcus sp. HMF7620]|uniref:Methyltransferase domain-containing protein n=1 Tax=Deinococcus arboris TaxID=2682977 RepID=A0A7C9HRZ6_9DEIO|nr:class I SAM-dependent methyltransferase [Deinococcus arboris]MVN87394.1 methyltransferase domain-containing protein [Deinococcus arboris]